MTGKKEQEFSKKTTLWVGFKVLGRTCPGRGRYYNTLTAMPFLVMRFDSRLITVSVVLILSTSPRSYIEIHCRSEKGREEGTYIVHYTLRHTYVYYARLKGPKLVCDFNVHIRMYTINLYCDNEHQNMEQTLVHVR